MEGVRGKGHFGVQYGSMAWVCAKIHHFHWHHAATRTCDITQQWLDRCTGCSMLRQSRNKAKLVRPAQIPKRGLLELSTSSAPLQSLAITSPQGLKLEGPVAWPPRPQAALSFHTVFSIFRRASSAHLEPRFPQCFRKQPQRMCQTGC